MSDSTESTFDQAASFQKLWMETFTKMAQTGFSISPDSAPPEFLRQMRSGIFQALSKSWEEYMRSPQFRDSMKTMMDNAITFRKMGNEMLTQAHHGMQGTARVDIDDLMQAIHHLETRILDRVEEVTMRLDKLEEKLNATAGNGAAKRAPGGATRSTKPNIKRARAARKQA
jgi:hypothetical protein